ncbi:MAG TPA: hypothetical protein VEX68_13630 [Bryobacteraceae bacterium]|nr:hypothetical protein [Bryobacteraceae bacterium]
MSLRRPENTHPSFLEGPLFSDETQVNVNGVKLIPKEPSSSGPAKGTDFGGEFEVPNSKLLIFRYQCPAATANYVGTPEMLVYSPTFPTFDIRNSQLAIRLLDGRKMKTSFAELQSEFRAGRSGDVLCRPPSLGLGATSAAQTIKTEIVNRRLDSHYKREVVDAVIKTPGLAYETLHNSQILVNTFSGAQCRPLSCFRGECVEITEDDVAKPIGELHKPGIPTALKYFVLPQASDTVAYFNSLARIPTLFTDCGFSVVLKSAAGLTMGTDTKNLFSSPRADVARVTASSATDLLIELTGSHLDQVQEVKARGKTITEPIVNSRFEDLLRVSARRDQARPGDVVYLEARIETPDSPPTETAVWSFVMPKAVSDARPKESKSSRGTSPSKVRTLR